MSNLFTAAWMSQLKERWNASADITDPLGKAGFSARIAYGFKGEDNPRGLIVIENGLVASAGSYGGEALDWDLRATPEKWADWINNGFGLMKLGPAVATGALKFVQGNYRQMIRNPSLANPFLKHFELMQDI